MVFESYAENYDVFYQGKDYQKECRYLKNIFSRYARKHPHTILDLGCGTGNYLIPLARMKYKLTGVDASPQMLAIAQTKLRKFKLKAELQQGLLQHFRINRNFDAVICMFSVIDYVTKTADVSKTFKNIHQHMKPGAVFVFDFWQKEAVEEGYSKTRKRIFKGNGCRVERSSQTTLLREKNMCKVQYHCVVTKGKDVCDQYDETHTLRYFSITEMKIFLEKAGFKVLNVHPFLKPNGRLKKSDWDVTMVARKKTVDCRL